MTVKYVLDLRQIPELGDKLVHDLSLIHIFDPRGCRLECLCHLGIEDLCDGIDDVHIDRKSVV